MQSARFTTTLEEISSVVELGGQLLQKNEDPVPVWSHFVGILSNVGSMLPLPAAPPDSRKAVSHHFDYYSDSDSDSSDCSDEDFGLEFQTCGSESRDCSDRDESPGETKQLEEIYDAKRGVEDVVEESKTPLGFSRVVSADRALCILPSIVEVDEEEDEVLSPISLGKFENDIGKDVECEFDSRKRRRRQWRGGTAGEEEGSTNESLIEELKEELRLAQQLIQHLQAQVGPRSELMAESCVDMKNGPTHGDTAYGTRPESTTTCASLDQSTTPPSIAKERSDEQQQDKIILTRAFGASRLMVKLTLRCNEVASSFSIIHKASYRDDASWTHWNVSMSLPLQEYIKCCCKSTGDEMMSSVLLFVRGNTDFAATLEDFDGVFDWTCHYPSPLPPQSLEERSLKSRQSDDGNNALPVRSSSFFSLELEPQVPSKDRFTMITEDLETLITPYGGENASKRQKEDVLRLLPLSLASKISHWRLCQQKQFKRLLLRVHQACKEVAAEHDNVSCCAVADPLSSSRTDTVPCIKMEERTVDFHWQPSSLNDVCSSDSDNSDSSDLTVNESKQTSARVNTETSEYSITPESDTKQENAARESNVSETVDGCQIDYEQLYRQSYDEDLAFQGRLESLHACLGEQLSLIHSRFLHELTCSQF